MPRASSTTARGYGYTHQQQREKYKPTVEAGRAQCTEPLCLMPTRWIDPRQGWDLAHDREATATLGRVVYRGPAHIRCNRSEGAKWRHKLKRLRTRRHWVL